jgi:hypothetical protein
MGSPTAAELFDDFAARYARGERPDAREYLERASGADADELAQLIDRFLEAAPPPAASPDAVETLRARLAHEPPLLRARLSRKLRRADVVERLRAALGLPETKADALGRRYHELETGQLEPAAVSARVWEALSALLGLDARRLASGWRPPRLGAPPAFLRADATHPAGEPPTASPASEDDPEVDRLFLSGA